MSVNECVTWPLCGMCFLLACSAFYQRCIDGVLLLVLVGRGRAFRYEIFDDDDAVELSQHLPFFRTLLLLSEFFVCAFLRYFVDVWFNVGFICQLVPR